MTGRKRDSVWLSFDTVTNVDRKGVRAKCKQCLKEIEGQVSRMKSHAEQCSPPDDIQAVQRLPAPTRPTASSGPSQSTARKCCSFNY